MLTLPKNEVHLYYTQADSISSDKLLGRYRAVLSPEEILKVDRYRIQKDRYLSLVARALVRYLVSEYTGAPAEAFAFLMNGHGKPYLAPKEEKKDCPKISFNISHSRGGIVCGICQNLEIGVDLEDIRRNVDLGIARRFFADTEVEFLNQIPNSEKKKMFFDIWTLKEAYIKAEGKGLAIPLDSFSFNAGESEIKIAFKAPKKNPSDWQFFRWWPKTNKTVAAAVKATAPLSLKTFSCIPFQKITPLS